MDGFNTILLIDLSLLTSKPPIQQDELDRASHADIMTIVISYILMFVYVSTTLGRLARSGHACCIQAKVSQLLTVFTNGYNIRVQYFWGRVPNFNQLDAR